ncbi:Histone-like protein transcription factor (CBF/NF-Y)-like protein [Sarcoptes scabiei]|uniref:Nuclear transcription factor Y subunit gamma n=1 Tax=Sarcoptes scabiei TaxID=52283 RepID=A0A131ZTA2_SARSC|nr:Histone-like protein transcription factor (CBF/NF-Y)-like protein [Sarcoptes scabiei]
MKLDEDVKMISGEAPILFAKAIEIFIAELSLRAWINTEESKRRTLQRNDIAMAITKYDQFDFLIDIVPREETKPNKRPDASIVITNDNHYNYYLQLAQQQSSSGQPIQIIQAANRGQFALSPQIIQVPVPSTPLNQNPDANIIASPTININRNSTTQGIHPLPITLSSQQYQTILQSQQNSGQNQPIILNRSMTIPTQCLDAGTVVEALPSSSTSTRASNSKPDSKASRRNNS